MGRAFSLKLPGLLARDVYALSNASGIDDAIKILNDRHHGRLDFCEKLMLKGKTGGPGFVKVRTAFGFVLEGKGQLQGHAFIIFRGTQYLADWLTNLNILVDRSSAGKLVHEGFQKSFKSMLPQMKPLIDAIPANTQIHCIGHSLGGA